MLSKEAFPTHSRGHPCFSEPCEDSLWGNAGFPFEQFQANCIEDAHTHDCICISYQDRLEKAEVPPPHRVINKKGFPHKLTRAESRFLATSSLHSSTIPNKIVVCVLANAY